MYVIIFKPIFVPAYGGMHSCRGKTLLETTRLGSLGNTFKNNAKTTDVSG